MSDPRAELRAAKYEIVNGWIVQQVDSCTCYGGKPYGHEPGCGREPLVQVEKALAAEAERAGLRAELEAARAEIRALQSEVTDLRDERESECDRANRADAELAEARRRLDTIAKTAAVEVPDAKQAESYAAEIDAGGVLMAAQARRFAWETVTRLLSASLSPAVVDSDSMPVPGGGSGE